MKKSALNKRAEVPYWHAEPPHTFFTRANVFRLYGNANMLSVSLPDFEDMRTGKMRMGKTVGIDLNALIESPAALKELIEILCTARDEQALK